MQNPDAFIKVFKRRFIVYHTQNRHEHVSNITRLSAYRMFKISVSVEPCLIYVINKHIIEVLIRIGVGASSIRVRKMRFVAHTRRKIWCVHHVILLTKTKCTLFYCESLHNIRQKYIPRKKCILPISL